MANNVTMKCIYSKKICSMIMIIIFGVMFSGCSKTNVDIYENNNAISNICFGYDTLSEEVNLNELRKFAFEFIANNIDWTKNGYEEIDNFQAVGGYYMQYKCNQVEENEICYIGIGVDAECKVRYPILAYCKNFKRTDDGKYNIEFELVQGGGYVIQEGEEVFVDAGDAVTSVLVVDYFDENRENSVYLNMIERLVEQEYDGISGLLNGENQFECTNVMDICVLDMADYINAEIEEKIVEYNNMESFRDESTFRN